MLPLLLLALLAPPDITFDSILTLPSLSPPVRAPFRPDPIQAALADHSFTAPREGDSFHDHPWTLLHKSGDNSFQSDALAGGYAFASFDSPDDRTMLLDAAGHAMLYFNGEPRAGDPYDYNNLRLPVHVHKGRNDILIQSGRGHLTLKLLASPPPISIDPADATLPDLVVGRADPVTAGLVIINATDVWQTTLEATAACEGSNTRTQLPSIPPMSVRKVPITLSPPANARAGDVEYHLSLNNPNSPPLTSTTLKLRVRTPDQTRKVTFLSSTDGSVQYYCINPSLITPSTEPTPRALVLSLHGASVQATNQANAYRPKPACDIVCPTNRRPFGFDWEDWGRTDALEVLDLAAADLHPDPSRIYLTGHSMGGHGTWSLGALYPDRFAAIAPSAGWISFWSYAGAQDYTNPTPMETIFRRAMAPSDTLAYARNYLHEGVYILHGDADDNVPVAQARTMRKRLAEDHADFAYYERPGADHWWGNECVDWPPLFDFLTAHTRPTDAATSHVEFITPNVGVSSQCHWATIQQPIIQNQPASIKLDLDRAAHTLKGETTNAARLRFDTSTFPDGPITISLDGSTLTNLSPTAHTLDLTLADNGWQLAPPLDITAKNPARTGPFKHALSHRALLIYATGGDDADRAWALNKARFDAETFYYRGNGSLDIIPDTAFKPDQYKDRSILLYGNADTNKAWPTLLAGSPLQVFNHHARTGDTDSPGDDITALFVYPRTDSAVALIGVIAPTGPIAQRACERTAYFSSGIAYPDWTLFSAAVLTDGLTGVRAAGFFDNTWKLDPSQTATP